MAVDVANRIDLRDLRSQLNGVAEVDVIGRREAVPIDVHRTIKVWSLDRADDFIWGRDYWNDGDLGDDRTEAYWDDTDDATRVLVRVVSMNNEFRFFTSALMDEFFDDLQRL